jgi:ABC-type transport system substrate-binding protein
MRKRFLAVPMSLLLLPAVLLGITAVSGQEPTIPRGEIFRHGRTESGPIANLNPFNPSGPGSYFGPYETLAYADTYSGEIKPLLAESWGFVDDYTFEIKLRPEAHWSDGTPVTAEDVAFSLDTLTNPTYGGARRAEVASYNAVDELTVHITLNEEYPNNRRVLGVLLEEIIPEARWSQLLDQYGSDIISYTDLDDLTQIVTSYPYLPYYVGPDRVIYIRDDNYWGSQLGWFPHAKYAEDYFYGSNEATVRAGYEGHGMDWSGVGFNEPQWYKGNKDYISCWDIDASPENMFFHEACCLVITPNYNYSVQDTYVFRYQWLRQALAYAADAAASLESGWAMCGNLYPPTFINPDLATYDLYVNEDVLRENFDTEIRGGHLCIAYSPTKAIEILQEYCDGSVEEGWTIKGTNVKLGYPTWTIQAVNGWADVMIEAKVIADGWSAIGIPTEPVYPEFGTWMSNYATGNYIWTQMWSWIRLSETANPIADTFYDNFILEPAAANIWSGSPGHYPLFFDGNHDPLPDTADEVRELTLSLYEVDSKSSEFIATVKELQSILVPQVPFIMPHGKSSTQGFVTDRWVNWPTADDPYEHRLDAVEPAVDLIIKHIRPKSIETTDFTLSPGIVEAGEPVILSVTLKNTANHEQKYQVEICEGVAKAGPGPDPIVMKVAAVPALGTVTVQLSVTIDEIGTHVLTVDDWRIDEADPGVPLEALLTVTEPQPAEEYTIKDAIDAADGAKTAADEAKTAADGAKTAADEAKTLAGEAKAAAEGAAPVWLVWASMIITIVVVLAGEYVITKSLKS